MNIAIIIRRLNVKGGAQRQALSLARELKKIGHNVAFYTFFYDKEKCFPDLLDGMDIHSSDVADPKKLSRMISLQTDLLNSHDQEAYKVAYYFKKFVKNIPSVWMMNDVPSKNFGFWKESQFNPDLRRSFAKAFYHALYDWNDKRFIASQEKITVLDNWNRELVKNHYGKDAIVVRSGLDHDQFIYSKHTPPPKNKSIKLLCAGIFFPHRRFEDVITTISLLQKNGRDASLTIIGDHNNDKKYYDKLLRWTHYLRLENHVKFIGKVSDEKLKEAYREHDIFIFVNHLQTWGLAVFEAMSCGIPVVVSRTSGASEVLKDRENAMLVNPKTPEEIKKAILELVSNPEFYFKISYAARKFVEQNISWQKYAREMFNVFSNSRE